MCTAHPREAKGKEKKYSNIVQVKRCMDYQEVLLQREIPKKWEKELSLIFSSRFYSFLGFMRGRQPIQKFYSYLCL